MHKILYKHPNSNNESSNYYNLNADNLNIMPNKVASKNLNVELRSKDKFAIPFSNNNIGQSLLNYRGIIL